MTTLHAAQSIELSYHRFAGKHPELLRSQKRSHPSYDVLITTDAFGVGINLQDASVVINYDAAWTAISPIQRAGRVQCCAATNQAGLGIAGRISSGRDKLYDDRKHRLRAFRNQNLNRTICPV